MILSGQIGRWSFWFGRWANARWRGIKPRRYRSIKGGLTVWRLPLLGFMVEVRHWVGPWYAPAFRLNIGN